MIKRSFDVVIAALGLLLLSPIFLVIAVLIKITSKGPIFFAQKRVGRELRPFQVLKFRSMVTNADKIGNLITAANDSRVTWIGFYLRKTKLDELPQLLNVLRGEMSLVGPRPEVSRYVELFLSDYVEILKVRPGITDWASIEGIDEESVLAGQLDIDLAYREKVLPQKIRRQLHYVRTRNAWTDFQIMLLTVKVVLLKIFRRSNPHLPNCRLHDPQRGLPADPHSSRG